jgi:uncharacterized protein involved in response to NO
MIYYESYRKKSKERRKNMFLKTFTSAPHRVMFLGGAFQGVAAILWWLVDLTGRFGEYTSPIQWTIPPASAHLFLMIYGFFPFFIFGFLFTVFPRWMNGEEISIRHYLPAFLYMSSGILIFYLGLLLSKTLLFLAVLLFLTGWSIGTYALLRLLFKTAHPDKRHPAVAGIALTLGGTGIISYFGWLLTGVPGMLELSWIGGIWFFLLPVFVTVSHLMIPFFSSAVLEKYIFVRRYWIFWSLLGAIVGHGFLELLHFRSVLWIPDFVLGGLTLFLSYRWGFLKSLRVKLLAVLHIGFFWLSIAAILYFIQSLTLFLTDRSVYLLSLAPLHALTIGFFASMVIGMASRVTLGHSGRPLIADRTTWVLFLLLQGSSIARVLGDILLNTGMNGTLWYLIAGGLWLAAFVPWGLKYAPIYWRPRVDGKAG